MNETPADRQRLREELFRETPLDWLERNGLGIAWSFAPERVASMPALTWLWLKDVLARSNGLPDPESSLNAGGVVGICRDLSVPTLIEASKRGLYPHSHVGRPKWWSPEQRAILDLEEFHIGKQVRRTMRRGDYRVTFDQDFERVITACAGKRPGHWHLNWITPKIMWSYADLFDAGIAHSFEVWDREGELVGGGYGIAVGSVYIGESLFSLRRDTSKIGVAMLVWHLAKWGYSFIDTKHMNPLMESFGFRAVPRAEFLALNEEAMAKPGRIGRWHAEAGTEVVADWRPDHAVSAAPKAEADHGGCQHRSSEPAIDTQVQRTGTGD
ncbi:leucyl/phenylalanyl-tRNA--protein transferase [Methyloligella sp. 2.7D]|uniref:leucyl/phenylalanyl-tRNA--protein transferase n=1 Tax=unclassified Methyloligella TaxID=2625955 RepID=UPI00157C1715|nr:leucyl/phenylalanyl-tRNA--protein transferase [Methyloligella sp. GL2]QKP77318.1 leucyl/phenylalanyl-tRNA--protein transferase [Methyloligella sp. GL2]